MKKSIKGKLACGITMVGALFAAGPTINALETRSRQSEIEKAWVRLQSLAGHWEGTANGKPGSGRQETRFVMILQSQYLMVTNRCVFEPQSSNSKGEVHEDITIFSLDKPASKIVARQFTSEGFITKLTLDRIGEGGSELVFKSGPLENAPPQMRSQLTLRWKSKNEIRETCALAFDGVSFDPCVESRLTRKR